MDFVNLVKRFQMTTYVLAKIGFETAENEPTQVWMWACHIQTLPQEPFAKDLRVSVAYYWFVNQQTQQSSGHARFLIISCVTRFRSFWITNADFARGVTIRE